MVVTGLSGGGRSTVARALENVGYYVVDNLPQALMLDMAELASRPATRPGAPRWCSTCAAGPSPPTSPAPCTPCATPASQPRVVFVDADDEVLMRRFESVRRSHPLQGDGRLADGIARRARAARGGPRQADVVIDTSHLNVNQLRAPGGGAFGGEDARRLRVTVLSFGFKYGLPPDADFVMDARFLPNPHWVPELRDHTGLRGGGQRVRARPGGRLGFRGDVRVADRRDRTGYQREGKRYLTVAVGLHRRQAPQRGHRRGAGRAAARACGCRPIVAPRPGAGVTAGEAAAAATARAPERPAATEAGRAPVRWWRSAAGTGSRLAAGSAACAPALALDITAVVTVGDDGGSSGRLRDELGRPLPPGDLRQALAALADDRPEMQRTAALLQHRFATVGDPTRWPGTRSATCCCSA